MKLLQDLESQSSAEREVTQHLLREVQQLEYSLKMTQAALRNYSEDMENTQTQTFSEYLHQAYIAARVFE